MLQDLKLAQYTKLPWRARFIMQTVGGVIGSILNSVIMKSIILLDVQGS